MHIINKAGSETLKKDKKKYESFSFIQHECDKSIDICLKIEAIVNDMLRDLQTDSLIQLMLDANKNIQPDLSREMQFDEEFKVCKYSTVPDEIYGKQYEIVDLSMQSMSLIENFEDKIKKIIDILDTRDKNLNQITERFSQIYPVLQEILLKNQNQLQTVNDEQKKLQQKISEKEKEIEMWFKEISLKDAQFYADKLEIDLEEFKTKFSKSSEIYYKLGQFQYNHSDFTPWPIQQSIYTAKVGKAIYLGQLKEGADIKEGIGIVVASNGGIYEGCWKNNKRNGKGRYIYDNGEYYIGDNKDGKMHGYGIYYWADGRKYTGEFKDDEMNGQGTFYYTDGSWWTGEWKNGRNGTKNGLGTEYAADGTVLRSGNWVDDKYVEQE